MPIFVFSGWSYWGDNGKLLLTHWDRDKMAAIFADDIFKHIFMNGNIQISLNFTEFCCLGSNW